MSVREHCYKIGRELADEYDDWEFVAGDFKNKKAKFCVVGFSPFSSVSSGRVSFQPLEWVKVNSLTKIKKKIFPEKTISVDFTRQVRHLDGSRFTYYAYNGADAEPILRQAVDIAMPPLLNRYDLSSVEAFVENFPSDHPDNFRDNQGVHYCLLRMLIGDFDFIHSYHEKALATSRGYRLEDIERILPYVDEMKTNWEKTGKLM